LLILIATLLALVPAIAVLYPILRAPGSVRQPEGDESDNAELSLRLQENIAALRNIELERSLGNLDDDDYAWLRERYMTEAAVVLKALDLEAAEEASLLKEVGGASEGGPEGP